MASAALRLFEAGRRAFSTVASSGVRRPCIGAAARAFCLLACVPTQAGAEAVPVWFGAVPSVINSPVFARWAPLRGQLGYLQSIAYIDSRIRCRPLSRVLRLAGRGGMRAHAPQFCDKHLRRHEGVLLHGRKR